MKIYYSFKQKILEQYLSSKEQFCAVFMFHEIRDDFREQHQFSIGKKSFEAFIRATTEKSKCIRIDQIECMEGKNFCITFDDAYDSVYKYAFPVLKDLKLPFTVFLATGLIGKKGYLTKEMIEELAESELCTIGVHSINHPLLRFCDFTNAKYEIDQSKKILEALVGKEVSYFAYPYGSIYACSRRDIEIVKNSGFELAFSTLNTGIGEINKKNKFFLPRINVNEENYADILENYK